MLTRLNRLKRQRAIRLLQRVILPVWFMGMILIAIGGETKTLWVGLVGLAIQWVGLGLYFCWRSLFANIPKGSPDDISGEGPVPFGYPNNDAPYGYQGPVRKGAMMWLVIVIPITALSCNNVINGFFCIFVFLSTFCGLVWAPYIYHRQQARADSRNS